MAVLYTVKSLVTILLPDFARSKGFLQTMFDYGHVYVQTAGATERFNFEEVPNPREVAGKIIALAEEDRKYHLQVAAGNELKTT